MAGQLSSYKKENIKSIDMLQKIPVVLSLQLMLIGTIFSGCLRRGNPEITPNPFETANPAEYGLDDQEIQTIESHILSAIDSSFISGAVALVAKNDKIIYHKAFGHSDRNKTHPMSTNNIFRMASMTKPITSTAIMQLVEEEKSTWKIRCQNIFLNWLI